MSVFAIITTLRHGFSRLVGATEAAARGSGRFERYGGSRSECGHLCGPGRDSHRGIVVRSCVRRLGATVSSDCSLGSVQESCVGEKLMGRTRIKECGGVRGSGGIRNARRCEGGEARCIGPQGVGRVLTVVKPDGELNRGRDKLQSGLRRISTED